MTTDDLVKPVCFPESLRPHIVGIDYHSIKTSNLGCFLDIVIEFLITYYIKDKSVFIASLFVFLQYRFCIINQWNRDKLIGLLRE